MTLDLVVAGYIVKDGKVLLVDHKKLGVWLPAGGHIEENETPDDALRREIGEELDGLEVEFVHYPNPRRGNDGLYALPFYTNVHHIKGDHLHYCLFYLCYPTSELTGFNRDELNGIGWFESGDLDNPRIPESVKLTALEAIKQSDISQ